MFPSNQWVNMVQFCDVFIGSIRDVNSSGLVWSSYELCKWVLIWNLLEANVELLNFLWLILYNTYTGDPE